MTHSIHPCRWAGSRRVRPRCCGAGRRRPRKDRCACHRRVCCMVRRGRTERRIRGEPGGAHRLGSTRWPHVRRCGGPRRRRRAAVRRHCTGHGDRHSRRRVVSVRIGSGRCEAVCGAAGRHDLHLYRVVAVRACVGVLLPAPPLVHVLAILVAELVHNRRAVPRCGVRRGFRVLVGNAVARALVRRCATLHARSPLVIKRRFVRCSANRRQCTLERRNHTGGYHHEGRAAARACAHGRTRRALAR
jgi:hypothetical protein